MHVGHSSCVYRYNVNMGTEPMRKGRRYKSASQENLATLFLSNLKENCCNK